MQGIRLDQGISKYEQDVFRAGIMSLPICVASITVVPHLRNSPVEENKFLKMRCEVALSSPLNISSNKAIRGREYTALASA